MKRIARSAIFIAVLITAIFCGCSENKKVTGQMHYNNYGTEYGIRVEVAVVGDKIKNVRVLESEYVEVSPLTGGWSPKQWERGIEDLVKAYRGQKVSDVLKKEVVCKDGVPLVRGDEGFKNYGSDIIISGATLASGRLLIAVQDALKKL